MHGNHKYEGTRQITQRKLTQMLNLWSGACKKVQFVLTNSNPKRKLPDISPSARNILNLGNVLEKIELTAVNLTFIWYN